MNYGRRQEIALRQQAHGRCACTAPVGLGRHFGCLLVGLRILSFWISVVIVKIIVTLGLLSLLLPPIEINMLR